MDVLSHLTAVILAGGLGTRLRSAVADRPKVLAEVNGRPFLAYILDQLVDAGIPEVVLCTGYLGEQIEGAFGKIYRGCRITYSREQRQLGTGGALRLALEFLDSDPVLVLNGDSFCDTDLNLFLKIHRESGTTASILLAQVPDVSRYGSVECDMRGHITRFEEKGGMQGSGMINAGVYLLDRDVIEGICVNAEVSLERDLFPLLVGKGLVGIKLVRRFIDIGVPSDYLAASTFFELRTDSMVTGEAT